jgi:2-(1,2-epoxy-1,2-dihydrophenyl)acetyl-CoA isomerase
MAGTVRLHVDGAIARIVVSNPGRRNAASWPMQAALGEVVTELRDRDDVAVVVLTGAGADFCVGADLAAPPDQRTLRRDSIADDTERLRAVSAAAALHRLPQVTIAAIDGGCAGAGLSLALATDLRIATDRAVFNTAFVGVGVSGDFGSAWHLTRTVGPATARRLLLDPSKIDAAAALDLGLVTRVVAADALADATDEWARRIAAQAPLALRAAKQNLLSAEVDTFDDYLPAEIGRMVATFHTADAEEAAAAFLARRTPHFTGR